MTVDVMPPKSSEGPYLTIGGRPIGDPHPCYIVAEIGHNHQGDIETCRALFRAAKEAGADAVKLQKRRNRTLFTRKFYDSPYDNPNAFGPTYGRHREALEFDEKAFQELRDYAECVGIAFFATPFDPQSVSFLATLNLPAIKIASGDLRNLPLIRQVAKLGKPVILSTGGAEMTHVSAAVDVARCGASGVAVLQCTAAYPTADEDVNLAVIDTFREAFPDLVVGYSSHDLGVELSLCAIALGARIVEKHFTLDPSQKGTDHRIALNPADLTRLVEGARRFARARGDRHKTALPTEAPALYKMGKKLVAARAIPPGALLAEGDVEICSPGDGLAPDQLSHLIGRKLVHAIAAGEDLSWKHLYGAAE